MKKNKKCVLYSKNLESIESIERILKHNGFATEIDYPIGGGYAIYVPKEQYHACLVKAKECDLGDKVCMLNYKGEFRKLNSMSILYASVADIKNFDIGWQYEESQPDFIKYMLKKLKELCEVEIYLVANSSDAALEFLVDVDSENYNEDFHAKLQSQIMNYLNSRVNSPFDKLTLCEMDGRLIYDEKEDKDIIKDSLDRIYDTSIILDGIRYPEGSNIAPKPKEDNDLNESGYWTSASRYGGEYYESNFKVIDGMEYEYDNSLKLYEKKEYNSYWYAETQISVGILPLESMVEDDVNVKSNIRVLSKDEIEIKTYYTLKRKVSVKGERALNHEEFPARVSVRDGIFQFPLEDGEYTGNYTEHYVKIANGTRLLHYADESSFFEVFDIPEDFDFINNNTALPEYPKVFDDCDFDKNDKDLMEISKYLNPDAKNLIKTMSQE